MTITLAQLKGYARLAVGGSPSTAPGVTEAERLTEIVNGAGEHLFSRPWRWRERTAGGFDFTANQAFIDLSVDGSGNAISVDEVISLKPADTIKFSIDLVSPSTFEDFKRTNVETSLFYVATMARSAQTSAGLPAARLDLFPTPSTSSDDAVFIRYREGWPSYTTTSSETSNIPVPSFCEQLLIEYVRAFAEGSEDGTTQARIVAVDGGTLLDQALRKDGITTSDMGSLPMNRGFFLDDNTILAGVSQPGVSQGFELMWRGVWSSTASYTQDDLVRLDRDVYIATANSTGQTPPNTDYWDIFCLGGLNGAGGTGGSGGGGGITSVNGISDTDNDGNIVLGAVNVGAANLNHQHIQGDVTGLVDALAGKPDKATINNITDVDTTGVQDDQVLQWDNVASKWKPSTLSGGGTSAVNSVNGATGTVVLNLTDLNNVTAPSPTLNQVLQWSGFAWENETITLALDGLSDVSAATPATHQLLAWSGSAWNAVTRPKSINGQTGETINLGSSDLSDVTLEGTIAAGEVLTRNQVGDTWVNQTLAEAGIAAASHSHTIGEVGGLQGALNDKSPTNHTHAIADLSNVSTATPNNDDVLKFNASTSTWTPAADATGGGGGGSLPSGVARQILVCSSGSTYTATFDDAFIPAPGAGESTSNMAGTAVLLRKKAWSPAHNGLANVYRKSFFLAPGAVSPNQGSTLEDIVLPTALNSFSELLEVTGYGMNVINSGTQIFPFTARRGLNSADLTVEALINPTGTSAVLTAKRGSILDQAVDGFLICVDLTAPLGSDTVQTTTNVPPLGGGADNYSGTFPAGEQPRVGMTSTAGGGVVTAVNQTNSNPNTWTVTYTNVFSVAQGTNIALTMPAP